MSNEIESRAMLAYVIIKTEYEKDDNNLNDVLYHFMYSYLFDDCMELYLYADEFKIYTGREGRIEEVINYIFKNIRR